MNGRQNTEVPDKGLETGNNKLMDTLKHAGKTEDTI